MRSRFGACVTALTVISLLAIPGRAAAQHQQDSRYPYVLVDLGTLGGPQSTTYANGMYLNNRGMALGQADTAIPDPSYPNQNPFLFPFGGPDPTISHMFLWQNGHMTDLGALPGVNNSGPYWLDARGDVAGASNTGAVDPLTGYPAAHAVVWTDGRFTDLGTLAGGYESVPLALNDRGQVVGQAENTIPDPFSLAGNGWTTQTRAFLWQDGAMHDLGTLGGPDAVAFNVNDQGQIAGWSYSNATPNPATGIPTVDPFLWQGGQMQDLGTLGGSFGVVSGLNDLGQVAGQSNLAGDQTFHPFLWTGGRLTDLGTLGGNDGAINWLTDTGQAVGWANLPIPCSGCAEPGNQVYHAAAWRQGATTDLGTLPGYRCSVAFGANLEAQIVGTAGLCHGGLQALLWDHGSMTNLNSVVAPSALQLTYAFSINDRGEIAGNGVLNGNQHAFLLIPTDEAEGEGITTNTPTPGTVAPAAVRQASAVLCAGVEPWRARPARGHQPACLGG